ncbi:MAG: RNA polymerase sigma factor [Phycisphaerae bacterium]|nr:RNA polymerase sigma factor [Phycisphaerae bacterium]
MATDEGDAYLIDAVQRGDQDAWNDIIARYEGRLVSFARRRLAERAEAEDIVQETFLGLVRSLPNYDRRRSLETYLFAILRNKLIDHFRKLRQGERQSLDQLDLNEAPSDWLDVETPSRYLADREGIEAQRGVLVDVLREWVAKCQREHRFQDLIVVEMLVVLGLRNKEVASDLGLGETAVAGIKFRVLEQWRRAAEAARIKHDWQEGDLAQDSTLARIWQEEGISCLKRSTLGRYLLGALEDDWQQYVEFHVSLLACERCSANLDDLRGEDERDDAGRASLRERVFASSIGFLSHRPE